MRRPAVLGRRTALAADETRSEAFRVLRANLLVALEELERATVIVTSALPNEGKTAVCANLALSLAEAGFRVVAIDTDLRHPSLHTFFAGHNEVGLVDVLLERSSVESALQYVTVGRRGSGLYLLATGGRVNDPTELLGGARTSRLLDALAQQADIVVLDSPPVLPVADTLVIGRACAGAVLVVESGQTPTGAVQQAKNALIRNQTRILGIVLNKVQPRDVEGAGLGYYPSPS